MQGVKNLETVELFICSDDYYLHKNISLGVFEFCADIVVVSSIRDLVF